MTRTRKSEPLITPGLALCLNPVFAQQINPNDDAAIQCVETVQKSKLRHSCTPPSFLRRRLCKKPSPSRVTCGKPLPVWLFFWVPAFAGTTNVGFLHSLEGRNPENSLFHCCSRNRHSRLIATYPSPYTSMQAETGQRATVLFLTKAFAQILFIFSNPLAQNRTRHCISHSEADLPKCKQWLVCGSCCYSLDSLLQDCAKIQLLSFLHHPVIPVKAGIQ